MAWRIQLNNPNSITMAATALAKLLREFCFNTVTGHESGIYKGIYQGLIPMPIGTLREEKILIIIKDLTINYLNGAYVSLIKKDDPYILNKFDAMCKINGHSAICLLNIIMVFIMGTHSKLDRSTLDIRSYDSYMCCIKSQLDAMREPTLEILVRSISHTCTGTDISTCDPSEPMFY